MFVEISTLNGGVQLIRTATIIRIRPSFGDFEPADASVIDYADKRFYSADNVETVAQKIGSALLLAQFHTPNKLPLVVDAAKVVDIGEPIDGLHHPKCRSVLGLETGKAGDVTKRSQVRETLLQSKKIISSRLGSADAPSV